MRLCSNLCQTSWRTETGSSLYSTGKLDRQNILMKTTNDGIKASKFNSITKTKNTTSTTVLSLNVGSLIPMPADLRVGFYYLLAYVSVLHGFTHRKNSHASEQIPLYFGRENVVKKCLECRIFNFITMI